MPMLTASDLTANPVSANAHKPQFSAAGARWRSGYAPDCKSKADATESYEVGEVPPSFPVLDSLENSSRLLTDDERWDAWDRRDAGAFESHQREMERRDIAAFEGERGQ